MAWSFTNLLIQIFGGAVGAHVALAMANEKKFGFVVQTFIGACGGGLSGCFLQTLAVTMVTGTGSLNELRLFEHLGLQALTGLSAGGIAALAVIILKSSGEQH